MEVDERTAVTIDHLYDHIVLAAAHYQDVLDHQFNYVVKLYPVWNKQSMWEDYYYPIYDALEEIWDGKRDDYLKTLK